MRKLVFACVLLLLLTNIVVLAGVAYNRSGEPLSSLELTERELPVLLSFSNTDENSGTTLALQWQILDPDNVPAYLISTYGTPAWLDDKKLTELGFEMKKLNSDTAKYRDRTSNLSTEVILVLEYEGEAYHKAVALAEDKVEKLRKQVADSPEDNIRLKELSDSEVQLIRLKKSQTHLYVIDADLDEQVLMRKYAGKNNILLARGEIGLSWSEDEISGLIRQMFIGQVHVPLPFSEQLTNLTAGKTYSAYNKKPIPPRYKVRLNIGKRLEPWIESLTQME